MKNILVIAFFTFLSSVFAQSALKFQTEFPDTVVAGNKATFKIDFEDENVTEVKFFGRPVDLDKNCNCTEFSFRASGPPNRVKTFKYSVSSLMNGDTIVDDFEHEYVVRKPQLTWELANGSILKDGVLEYRKETLIKVYCEDIGEGFNGRIRAQGALVKKGTNRNEFLITPTSPKMRLMLSHNGNTIEVKELSAKR